MERNIVAAIRADIDTGDVFVPSRGELARNWKLNTIFKEIINDPFKDC